CIFQPRAIESDVLRDAINHHVVGARLALDHLVDLDEFRADIFAARFLIHPLDKRRRKTVFLAKKDSDFFHKYLFVISSGAGGEVEKSLTVVCPAARRRLSPASLGSFD